MPRIGEIRSRACWRGKLVCQYTPAISISAREPGPARNLRPKRHRVSGGSKNTETPDHKLTPFRGRSDRRCLVREARIMPARGN